MMNFTGALGLTSWLILAQISVIVLGKGARKMGRMDYSRHLVWRIMLVLSDLNLRSAQ